MPPIGPTKRKNLISGMRQLGFDGPFSGGNHMFMKRGALKIRIPNTDVDKLLLKRIIKQIGITEEEWERLD